MDDFQSNMEYPSESEAALVKVIEALMKETMKKYDPSHDALHGTLPDNLYDFMSNNILL